jgi:hypothetical protein
MDIYAQIATKIIEKQETIIGPVAIEQASAVTGLEVDWPKHEVKVSGNEPSVIDKLVNQYKGLFGKISVEVSKEATSKLVSQLPADQQPATLK